MESCGRLELGRGSRTCVGPKQDFIEELCQIHRTKRTPVKFDKGLHLRICERQPASRGVTVGSDVGNVPMGGNGGDGSEQGSEDSEAAHSWKIRQGLGELRG